MSQKNKQFDPWFKKTIAEIQLEEVNNMDNEDRIEIELNFVKIASKDVAITTSEAQLKSLVVGSLDRFINGDFKNIQLKFKYDKKADEYSFEIHRTFDDEQHFR